MVLSPLDITMPSSGKLLICNPLMVLPVEANVNPSIPAPNPVPSMITPALEPSMVKLPCVIDGRAIEVTVMVEGVPEGNTTVSKYIASPVKALVSASLNVPAVAVSAVELTKCDENVQLVLPVALIA